jgi:hypothetical protein
MEQSVLHKQEALAAAVPGVAGATTFTIARAAPTLRAAMRFCGASLLADKAKPDPDDDDAPARNLDTSDDGAVKILSDAADAAARADAADARPCRAHVQQLMLGKASPAAEAAFFHAYHAQLDAARQHDDGDAGPAVDTTAAGNGAAAAMTSNEIVVVPEVANLAELHRNTQLVATATCCFVAGTAVTPQQLLSAAPPSTSSLVWCQQGGGEEDDDDAAAIEDEARRYDEWWVAHPILRRRRVVVGGNRGTAWVTRVHARQLYIAPIVAEDAVQEYKDVYDPRTKCCSIAKELYRERHASLANADVVASLLAPFLRQFIARRPVTTSLTSGIEVQLPVVGPYAITLGPITIESFDIASGAAGLAAIVDCSDRFRVRLRHAKMRLAPIAFCYEPKDAHKQRLAAEKASGVKAVDEATGLPKGVPRGVATLAVSKLHCYASLDVAVSLSGRTYVNVMAAASRFKRYSLKTELEDRGAASLAVNAAVNVGRAAVRTVIEDAFAQQLVRRHVF